RILGVQRRMLHIQGGLSKFRAFSSCSKPFFQYLTLSRTKPDFDVRSGSILFQAFLVMLEHFISSIAGLASFRLHFCKGDLVQA
ncbi:hypothetical protein, partial [Streptococcus suis]|uniref:hypothetical protein n=1 Tax=Streptococcus suis TaxID=1307 RepID=UPI001EDD65C5